MKRTGIFLLAFIFTGNIALLAEKDNEEGKKLETDTIHSYYLNEITITSSSKETNRIEKLPGSVSVLTPLQLDGMQLYGVKDISSVVPNFLIPDYGSKMTAPVYIRGIGNRSTGQAAGMYVDNAPYLNKSTFDFDFIDIQRIEVLRGPQGTLYGRNAMGGIINIFTPSPLAYQGTKIGVSGGNYGYLKAKASNYTKVNEKFGFSLSGYYDRNDGFFTNQYTGKKADNSESAGGRLRLDFKLSESFNASFVTNYDYVDQSAFPYGLYNSATGKTDPVNYNDEGSYNRQMLGNTLNLEYRNKSIVFSSTSSYQYLNDDMNMDQDFTPLSRFTLSQKQKQHTISQEFAARSDTKRNYQWSFGLFGFNNDLTTDATVNIKETGIDSIQAQFDKIKEANPKAPEMIIQDNEMPIPGIYKTPAMGGAIFHQSTINNLLIEGLSFTAGVRLDYEKDKLDYNTNSKMDLNIRVTPPFGPPIVQDLPLDTTLLGSESMHFTQILPKFALKYEFNKQNYAYVSASKGYNPGGYNIQVFSGLSEEALMQQAYRKGRQPMPEPTITIKDAAYDPEISWNFETGFKGDIIRDRLSARIALFYIDIDDMQLTRFIDSGEGRMIANVGSAVSKGLEISLDARILPELFAGVNYGYTHATFENYNDDKRDYSGKYLPYVPQQTLLVYAGYMKSFHNKFIDRLNIQAQYKATGKIYWTEANDISQKFYGLLNMKAGVKKGIVSLDIWSKNLLNTEYNAFYVETMGNAFFQKGKPFQFGADLAIMF